MITRQEKYYRRKAVHSLYSCRTVEIVRESTYDGGGGNGGWMGDREAEFGEGVGRE
jgi:hypothetical protein